MSICTADAPRTRSDPNEFKNAVVARPVARPKLSTTPPRRLSSCRGHRVGTDDVGVQGGLVTLPGEPEDLPADARISQRHVARVDQRSLVPPLGQCLDRMGKRAQRTPGPLETRQRPPAVGEDVHQLRVERERGGQPIPVAGLPVAGRHRVTQGLIPVGVGIGDRAALLF